MDRNAGRQIGPYEIVSAIGAGGMGEVYRARDTRLKRDVALKILPESFASDLDRLARFQREAEVLASLNHPHIAGIYGIEESNGTRALVMELVEGEDLSERIARGPIPLDDALPIAKQIAEALEAAHEQGIIHRDLKPANIKLRPDGTVKVLDFGLAKLAETSAPGSNPSMSLSPTITSPALMTGVGVLLGTAAYMAPQQAKGRAADKRNDIWAFGCVLFEMLAGKRAFEAEDVSDTLALVLKGEPHWNALPADLPRPITTLIRACLEKDSRKRIADIAGALFVLEHQSDLTERVDASVASSTPVSSSARQRSALVTVVALIAAIAGASMWYAMRPAAPAVTRFFVTPPDDTTFVTGGRPAASAAISPDGRTLAFTAKNVDGKVTLWTRPIDALVAQPLPSTDDAQFPFWSPDSKFIAYATNDKLMKIPAAGGPPQTICAASLVRGGSWGSAGEIVYGSSAGPLLRVPSAGGAPSALTRVTGGQLNHRFPSYLPDGHHVIYYSQGSGDAAGLYVVSVDTGETQRLGAADSGALYDSQSGYLLFVNQGSLLAQHFDAKQLRLTDAPFPVAERVESGVFTGVTAFSLSSTGTLTYAIGSPSASGADLSWFDRRGKMVGTVGATGSYVGVDLSRDGNLVAVHRHDGTGGDIWVADTSRGTLSRLTFDPTQDYASPVWSPDQRRVAFGINGRGNKKGVLVTSSTGAGVQQVLVDDAGLDLQPTDWTPDGRSLIFTRSDPKTRADIWLLPLDGGRKPTPLITTPFAESNGQVSPDGKWLAYTSDETGQQEIYVRPFPTGDGKWQISNGGKDVGGTAPRWRGDGRELFYLDTQTPARLMAASIKATGSELEVGNPSVLFESGYVPLNSHGGQPNHRFAVSRDGQRFLIPTVVSVTRRSASPIAVVLNWAQGIQH